MVQELGFFHSMSGVLHERWGAIGALYQLNSRRAAHPLYQRAGSSDMSVFLQIFVDLEYLPLCDLSNVEFVLDCGANVGYSAAFLLSRFPSCKVLAVEPDPDNFAMLQLNLREYGNRGNLLCAGVWSHTVPMRVWRGHYRDGREWSVQVRPCEVDEDPDFHGVTIESLLAQSGCDRISLLKMDIEGAEAIVFQHDLDWLELVDAIAIELHDDSCFGPATKIFYDAIQGRGVSLSKSGEVTICRRVDPKLVPAKSS